MKKYEKYKEVGLPWLKEVPEGWGVGKNRNIFRYKKEINKNGKEKNVLALTLRGVINNDIENPIGLSPKDYATYQLFEKNDLVFKLIDLNNVRTSRVGVVHESGIMSSAYIRLCINNKIGYHKYFYYWFFKLYIEEVFNKLGNGVRETIGKDELLNMALPIPPLHEQEHIANFLDWKISEIDRLIELEKEHMNTLAELFSTKLNNIFDNIIGEKLKLRFIFIFGKGLNITKDNLGEKGNKCISYGDIHGKMKFSVDSRNDEFKKLSNVENVLISEFALLSKGDFIFADTSEDVLGSGDFTFVENGKETLYAGYHTVVAKPKIKFNYKFLAYQFSSNRWRTQIRKAINGIKVYSITQQILKQSEVILPEIEVQKKIVNILDDFNSKIKKYKKLSTDKITYLEELKQTLISDAITGKIDVRNIKIPQNFHGKEED